MNNIEQQIFKEFDEIKELYQARTDLIENNSSWVPHYTYYAYNCSYWKDFSKYSFDRFVHNALDDEAVAELKAYVETRQRIKLELENLEIIDESNTTFASAIASLDHLSKRLKAVDDEKGDLIYQIVNRYWQSSLLPTVGYSKRYDGPVRTGSASIDQCCEYLSRVLTDEFIEGLYDLDQKFNSVKEHYELQARVWARVKAPAQPA